MNVKVIVIALILLIGFYILGIISHRSNIFPLKQLKKYYQSRQVPPAKEIRMDASTFSNSDYTVIFTFGQSNSANFGQTCYTCKQEVINWHKGSFYKAQDPLKGAGGFGGSPWTRLGDRMIEEKLAKRIVFISIGQGGTPIANWAKGGNLHKLLLDNILHLNDQGIDIDHVFWHQGETDNELNTSKTSYIDHFKSIRTAFRDNGVKAPIYLAKASYIPVEDILLNKPNGCDPEIRQAQQDLIDRYDDVWAGPDTDALNKTHYRFDGVHFSDAGLWAHAKLWLEVLKR